MQVTITITNIQANKTDLSVELLGLWVEPEPLEEDGARVLGVALLLELVLGGRDPQRDLVHMDLKHATVDLADGRVPALKEERKVQI